MLEAELIAGAGVLGIPLVEGRLTDAVADRINELERLTADDDGELLDERTAWLVMYEGARLSVEHGVALSLAG